MTAKRSNCEQLSDVWEAAREQMYDFPRDHAWAIDHRENAELHALHVKYALKGLLGIDKAIRIISEQSKTSHCGILLAMYEERAKLILEDTSYWEAYSILMDLHEAALLTKLGDIFVARAKELEAQ